MKKLQRRKCKKKCWPSGPAVVKPMVDTTIIYNASTPGVRKLRL